MIVITGFTLATSNTGVAALVITALVMAAMVITGFTFATSNTGVAALVVTALVIAAMVITGFTLATSNTGIAALVITALVMAAMIVAGFAFATSNTGVAALVITAFAMAAVIVAGLTLAASNTGVAASIIAPLVVPVAAVITTAVKGHVLVAGSANHLIGALSPRYGAARDALMDGPVMHASAATAHAHAGRTPAARLTVATGEECKSGCDYRHSRTHD